MGLFDTNYNLFDTEGGLFRTEQDHLDRERAKLIKEYEGNYRNRDNPFRMAGYAARHWNEKNSPAAKQMRATETLMKEIDISRPYEREFAIKKLFEMGNHKGGMQLMTAHRQMLADEAEPALDTAITEVDGNRVLVNKQSGEKIKNLGPVSSKDTKPFTKEVIDESGMKRQGLFDAKTGDLIKYLGHGEKVDSSTKKDWFRETVIDENGKKRRGLFNADGDLQKYLGYGEEDDANAAKGTWVVREITNKEGKAVGTLYNSTLKKFDIPGLGEMSFASAVKLGYDIKETDPLDAGEAKTFQLTDGTYISGSYDPKTGNRTHMVNGISTPVPEGAIDVTYRIQQSPSLKYGDVEKLGEVSGKVEDFVHLIDTFGDDYGGYGLEFIGDAVNWIAKRTGGPESEQAIWWMNHDRLKNQVRHELFGSALTQTEKIAFDKITVNPGLHASVIKENLAAQLTIAKRAAVKIVQSMHDKGVPDAQLRSAVGEFVWNMAQPSRQMPTRVTGTDEDGTVHVE